MPISAGTAGTVIPCSDAVIPYSVGASHADFCHGSHLSIAARLCEMPVPGDWLLHCAPMLQSQRAQHLPTERHYCSIILRHCCWQAWPLPRACMSATPRQTGCLHCIPSVYHLFSISFLHLPFFKSICSWKVSGWFPGLCCWKQNRFCYLFQGAGQGEHQAKRWGFKGFVGWFFFLSRNLCLLPWDFSSTPGATRPGCDACSWLGHSGHGHRLLQITELGMIPSFLHSLLPWIQLRNLIDFH